MLQVAGFMLQVTCFRLQVSGNLPNPVLKTLYSMLITHIPAFTH
jgi:hypothetical protein